jgi:hypothetical protein
MRAGFGSVRTGFDSVKWEKKRPTDFSVGFQLAAPFYSGIGLFPPSVLRYAIPENYPILYGAIKL